MKLREYQLEAEKTDQVPGSRKDESRTGIMVPLLGLAGEAGTLLTEYKKWMREGESYQIFKERVAEELGDILWYVANIASKEELNLETIARKILRRARAGGFLLISQIRGGCGYSTKPCVRGNSFREHFGSSSARRPATTELRSS